MMSSERDKMLDMITEMNNWNYKKDKIIEDLQSQLDQQKAMWNNLKEFVNKKDLEYYSKLEHIGFNDKSSEFLFARYNFCSEIKNKIEELEKGGKDGNIK